MIAPKPANTFGTQQGHLQSACVSVPAGGWAVIRPDGYLADTGKSVNGDLIAAVATSLCL